MTAKTAAADQTCASGDNDSPERPGRFFQFGLRPLVVIVTLAACMFGLWRHWVQPYRLQRWAVDELVEGSSDIRPIEGPAQQRWLVGERDFVEYHSVRILPELPETKFDALVGLVFLRALNLDDAAVNDRQLMAVKRMPHLVEISFDHTSIGDDGLVACNGLSELGVISARYTRVTDAGLARLESLPVLETIYLTGTDVTDAGIVELGRHAKLRQVYARYTNVTEDGAEKLRSALPDCEVYYRRRHERERSQ